MCKTNVRILIWFCQMEDGELVPLLIAAGGGGNAYMENLEFSMDQIPLEQYENSTTARGTNGRTGEAGRHTSGPTTNTKTKHI